jgi:hypothetical protein
MVGVNSATYVSVFRSYFHIVCNAMSVAVFDPISVTVCDGLWRALTFCLSQSMIDLDPLCVMVCGSGALVWVQLFIPIRLAVLLDRV